MRPDSMGIYPAGHCVEPSSGELTGTDVQVCCKRLNDLVNVFQDETAWGKMDPGTLIYSVYRYTPVTNDAECGLSFGTTLLMPGCVGDEYFITQGHFHKKNNRGEYYWGIGGRGLLILMDRARSYRVERMAPGTIHYIPADTAHRVCNDGDGILSFGACWHADAGYDYTSIREYGFSVRVISSAGKTVLRPV